MKSKKLKMSPKRFNITWTVVSAVLLALIITATVLMNFFSLSMDIFLGRGAAIKTVPDNVSTWDTAYYTKKYDTADVLMNAALNTAERIAEEGEVLFKNNGILPLRSGAKVTPFGYRYISPVYGGTGSGAVNTASLYITTAQRAINTYFDVNTDVENALKNATATGMGRDAYERANNEGRFEGATRQIIEFESDIYNGLESSCEGTVGIVFIGRIGGEGRDLVANVEGSPNEGTMFFDGTEHHLQLSEREKEMIRFSKANCDNTIIILNTANVMEIEELMADDGDLSADAVLWIGDPGSTGFDAMGKILTGEVNPSGRTTDIWMTDIMADPVSKNLGNFEYNNLWVLQGGFPTPVGAPTEMNFLEYEENVYLGYRYYETVHNTGGSFEVFGQTGLGYNEAVQIPFGFGLSYETDFSQSITAFGEQEGHINMTVRVINNGTKPGKDVVQVYYNPPYTAFDIDNKIEKATVNLIAFAKTGDIPPGGTQDMELSFAIEDMASYCYTHEDDNGTVGAYVLEEGSYIISINKSSHEQYENRTHTVGSTIWYDSDNPRQSEIDAQSVLDMAGNPAGVPARAESNPDAEFIAASNLWQRLSDHMAKTDQLTRANGPLSNIATTPREDERTAPEGTAPVNADGTMTFQHIDLATDQELGNVAGSRIYTNENAATGTDNGLVLASLRGRSYYDPIWDELLDQLDLDDPNLYVALAASYDQTAGIESIGKPATVDFDGPQGIVGSITDSTEFTAYPCAPIIASTFNLDLAYEMGEMVGQEALNAGINSWYAPAVNIHRSPFSGRNFEYYSEDARLSGLLAASVISGTGDQGLICTLKHFAMNDEELYDNDRSRVAIWANEQAMRETYLRSFEIAVKEARATLKYTQDDAGTVSAKVIRGATGMMGSMNYVGFTFAGANYTLNTGLLRGEWGFNGFLISDMMMNAGSNSVDAVLRSGTDSFMAWGNAFTSLIEDRSSPTGIAVIRRAVKDMCYAIVNSNAMNGIAPGTIITYRTSPWIIWLTIANILVYGFIVAVVIGMVLRTRDSKRNPEKYVANKVKIEN
jgi:beta-glucosidase